MMVSTSIRQDMPMTEMMLEDASSGQGMKRWAMRRYGITLGVYSKVNQITLAKAYRQANDAQ